MIRPLAYLSFFSFAVLSVAAVWLGALNQDEGWYLYAAGLVGEGKMLYRDFFYTQGPLLPLVYSAFSFFWENWGLLGGRVLTWMFGALSIVFAVAYTRRLVSPERRAAAGLIVFLLLGSNLYHLYYLSIPKTYALGAFFTAMGFYNLTFASGRSRRSAFAAFVSGAALAFACGARVSLAVMPAVVITNPPPQVVPVNPQTATMHKSKYVSLQVSSLPQNGTTTNSMPNGSSCLKP